MKIQKIIFSALCVAMVLLPLNAAGPSLHAVLVIDTHDKGIGCEFDLKNWNQQLKVIEDQTGMTINSIVLKDKTWAKSDVLKAISGLKPDKNDAVLFYYSGHGFRFKDKSNQWPEMALMNSSMDLYEAYSLIHKKNPRLLIAIADSCNSYCPVEPAQVMFGKGADEALFKKNYMKLFVEAKGTIIASGCIAGQYSYGGSPDGGAYTSTLIRNIEAAARSENATWKQIFEASNKPLVGGRQQPQYKMDVDPANSIISADIDKEDSETAGGDIDIAGLEDPDWCRQAMDTRVIFNKALVEFESSGKVDSSTKEYKSLEGYITMQIGFMQQDKHTDSEKIWQQHLKQLQSGDLEWAKDYCRNEFSFWGDVVKKQACIAKKSSSGKKTKKKKKG